MNTGGSAAKQRNMKYPVFKNLSIAFAANAAGLIYGCIITFILPKFLDIMQYSYYQLYMFYAGYIGFLGIGWVDGLFLRYGGKYFDKLNKSLVSAEFRYFTLFEALISFAVVIYTLISMPEQSKFIIYLAIAACIIIYMPQTILNNFLLATGQIKEYSGALIIAVIMKLILLSAGIIHGGMTFLWYVSADLTGRLAAALYLYFVCRAYIFARPCRLNVIFNEIAANIKCGIFLMLSNVASMLIIGVVRQFIEISWDVETFGRISLTLALSNFVLMFINSLSTVLFPVIKRCSSDNLAKLYNKIRTSLMAVVLAILIFYVPVKNMFSLWLPQYKESLEYMAILFPICVFECKMDLLINTCYKSERKERTLLIINILTFVLSLIISYTACFAVHSLDLAVFSIIVVLAFRSIIAEIILSRIISVSVKKDIILEIMLVTIFIYLSKYTGGIKSTVIYALFYAFYLLLKRNDILFVISGIRKKC